MRKKIFTLLFCLCCVCVSAQAPVDIFDPFYEDVKIWENTGLIDDAPLIRPYPLQEIKRILNIVTEKGSSNQIRRAKEYQNRFFGKVFHFGGMSTVGIKLPKKQTDFSLSPVMELNFSLSEILTGSAHVNFSLLNNIPKQEKLPAFKFSTKDIAEDNSVVGKFTLLPMFNSGVAIGTPEYYFMAGMARTSFGPFAENNILIGKQGMHAGQFIFVVNKEKFTYNQTLLAISASNDKKSDLYPKKFLTAHSIQYRPLPWISLGIIDMMIYGKRFEPIYLIPLSAFFIGQSIFGFPDNSLLGLTFSIKPVLGLKLDCVLLADDLGFNEIIKFKSARWRMAGQFGISYALPKDYWFTFVDFNYTLITPYCYTHVDSHRSDYPNYQNFTHNGEPLGTNLPPNSDRINLKLKLRPLYGMDINISNTFIRHANITESINDMNDDTQLKLVKSYFSKEYTTDGSVFNHPTATSKGKNDNETSWDDHAFLYSTPFMKQKTIQYVNQLELELAYNFPIIKSGGIIQVKAGYIFEANINSGINKNIYKKNTSININDIDAVKAEQQKQLNEWRKNAKGKEFNHFLNFAIKIVY